MGIKTDTAQEKKKKVKASDKAAWEANAGTAIPYSLERGLRTA